MPATFHRIKTWVRERLTYSDLNGEFNNIINNLDPTGVGGYSPDSGTMNAVEDPAPYTAGAQVPQISSTLALADEIQRIRFVLSRFFGTAFWWTDPGRILAANAGDLVGYLNMEGASAQDAFIQYMKRGGIINPLSWALADVAAAQFVTAQKKFGRFSYACGNFSVLTLPSKAVNVGSISAHFRNLSAGDYIAYNPLLGLELYLDGAGLLSLKHTRQTTTVTGNGTTNSKDFILIQGGVSRAGSSTWQSAIAQFTLNDANGVAGDLLSLFRDGSAEGAPLLASDITAGVGRGGNWLFGAKRNDPTWDKFSAMRVEPNLEGADPWTKNVAGGSSAAISSDGVLTITGTNNIINYSKTTGVNLGNQTIEVKARITANSGAGKMTLINIRDNGNNRTLQLYLYSTGRIELFLSGNLSFSTWLDNPSDWNVFRITVGVNATLYINGVAVFITGMINGGAGGNNITFGSEGAAPIVGDFEYVALYSAGAVLPVVLPNTNGGFLDDISIAQAVYSPQVITQLLNSPASSVFGIDIKLGLTLPKSAFVVDKQQVGSSPTFGSIAFPSDGETPTEISVEGFFTSPSITPTASWNIVSDDGDLDFIVNGLPGAYTNLSAGKTMKRVLPPGLRKVGLSVVDIHGGINTITSSLISVSGVK